MIITGCQRSGTTTAAQIFQCSHELIFNPFNKILAPVPADIRECSWLAAPFVEKLSETHEILILVRHPLAIINSLEGIEFWDPAKLDHKQYRDFIEHHVPMLTQKICKTSVEKSRMYIESWWTPLINNSTVIRIHEMFK